LLRRQALESLVALAQFFLLFGLQRLEALVAFAQLLLLLRR
jgi:hypothetical protein